MPVWMLTRGPLDQLCKMELAINTAWVGREDETALVWLVNSRDEDEDDDDERMAMGPAMWPEVVATVQGACAVPMHARCITVHACLVAIVCCHECST
jgi:hypothetical protein